MDKNLPFAVITHRGNGHAERWLVEPSLCRISSDEEARHIEPKVMDVLRVLVQHRGEVVTKNDLLDSVWPGVNVVDSVLTRSVSALRKAFDDDARAPGVIETISKRGYRFVADTELSASESASAEKSALAIPVVAVLPVRSRTDDPAFVDGVGEQLISELGRMPGIAVVSGTSSMLYRDSGKSLPQIAAELGASNVVESSIQRDGSTLRVTARLIEVSSDCLIWSNSFEFTSRNLWSVQNDIARQIAFAIGAQLSDDERRPAAGNYTVPVAARDAYMKGRYFWLRRSPENDAKALEYFAKAIKTDRSYADAHAALADCYTVLALESVLPVKESHLTAKDCALTALELDPYSSLAHASLGSVRLFFEWDITGAELSFRRALDANPSNAEAVLSYAELLSAQTLHDEAVNLAIKACRLNPLDPAFYSNRAVLQCFAGDYAAAALSYRQSLELESRPRVWASLAKTLAMAGRATDAAEALDSINGTDMVDDLTAITWFLLGDCTAAHQALTRFEKTCSEDPGVAYRHTRVLAAAGDVDKALARLAQAISFREPWVIYSAVDPILQPLRTHPVFTELIGKIGL